MRAKKDLKEWRRLADRIHDAKERVKIGIVGKYFSSGKFVLADSYISVIEAIKHSCGVLESEAGDRMAGVGTI